MAESAPQTETQPTQQMPQNPGDFIRGAVLTRCVGAIAMLGVADALGNRPETAEELAEKIGANAKTLERVMRFISAFGIFENAGGSYRHNDFSRSLRDDHPMSAGAFARLLPDVWPLLGALDHSLQTGRPAAEKVVGGDYFAYLASNSDESKRYNEGMTSRARAEIAGLMQAYDFSLFNDITDIGGGRGQFIKAILDAYPKITGVLFDLPQVIDTLDEPEDSRLSHRAGSFFEDDVPACDAYLMMKVLHDWSDEECVAILKHLHDQAIPGTKLLIAETPIPEAEGPHSILMSDIVMMAYCSGRERELSEYKALFDAAGWRLDRVVDSPAGVAMLESSLA